MATAIIINEEEVRADPNEPLMGQTPWPAPSRFAALVDCANPRVFKFGRFNANCHATPDIGAAYDLFNRLYTGLNHEDIHGPDRMSGGSFIALISIDADTVPGRFENPSYILLAGDANNGNTAQNLLASIVQAKALSEMVAQPAAPR